MTAPDALYLEQWPERADRSDRIFYEPTGYGEDGKGNSSTITVYVKESAAQTPSPATARLAFKEWPIEVQRVFLEGLVVEHAYFCGVRGSVFPDWQFLISVPDAKTNYDTGVEHAAERAGIAVPSDVDEHTDRCPRCKLGLVLECNCGWWCSRRYDPENPCGWEMGDQGPTPADHATHVRKYKRRRAMRSREMLKPRRCDACNKPICCFFGQRSVEDLTAPGGVWILHPTCSPPIKPA